MMKLPAEFHKFAPDISIINKYRKSMKKFVQIVTLFCILNVYSLFPQSFKFGWITDSHIGAPGADIDLIACVDDINLRKDIGFVFVTGDVAEKGRNDELRSAKEILDKLKVPYYIIPGNHDTKWSESGGFKFFELWKDDKFAFEKHNIKFIGINSGIIWRGGGGHVTSEDILWLDSVVTATPANKEIYFFIHHQLESEIDNWFKVTNVLRKKNIKVVFCGHGHANKFYDFNGIPGVMGRSPLSRGKSWGYNIVETKNDSVFFYEVTKEGTAKSWGAISKLNELNIPQVDSLQFKNYGVDILWQKDLKSTLSASLVGYGENLFAAAYNGLFYCWDSKTGELNWKQDLHAKTVSAPTVYQNLIAAGNVLGDLVTMSVTDGTIDQIIGIGEPVTSQLITVPLVYGNETTAGVVVGTSSGKMYCYEIYYLNPVWENTDASMMIETKPLFEKDRLVYGSWDNYLYCIDASSGMMNWKWTENKNFYYSPAAVTPVCDGKNVYVSTPDKFVSSIDLMLGKTNWRKNDFGSWESIGISGDKQKLFVKSITDKLHIVSAKDGRRIKEIDAKFGLDTMPIEIIEVNGKIFFGTKSGMVYSVDEKYQLKPLLYLGTSRVHSIKYLGDDSFAASNMDGKIVVFKLQ